MRKEFRTEYITHFKYMTPEERIYLMSVKDNVMKQGIIFATHAIERMGERWIKEKDVLRAINNGQIMEYKKTKSDEILTIRGCTLNRKNEQIYVILSVKNGKVITTYSNKYWIARNKSSELDKYNNNRKIFIPNSFKRQLDLFH